MKFIRWASKLAHYEELINGQMYSNYFFSEAIDGRMSAKMASMADIVPVYGHLYTETLGLSNLIEASRILQNMLLMYGKTFFPDKVFYNHYGCLQICSRFEVC